MQQKSIILLSFIITIFFTACGGNHDISQGETNTTKHEWKSDGWALSSNETPKFKLQTEDTIKDFSTIVYDKHPRLYMRDTDLAYLKSKRHGRTWTIIKNIVSQRISNPSDIQASLKTLDEKMSAVESTDYARLMVLIAYLENNQAYKKLSIAWGEYLAAKVPEDSDGDIPLRIRIERLSEIYDWMHDAMTKKEQKTIRDGLLKQVRQLMRFDYMTETTNYVQKHSRWGHGVVAEALLSLYGDFDDNFTKAYADDLLSTMREHLRHYEETESYIAKDGGWHLGWGYAYFNTDYLFNYYIWTTATNETMFDDWIGGLTYWFLYALRSDMTLPRMGDATVSPMGYGALDTLYQAKFKQDPYAAWYLHEYETHNEDYNNFFARFMLQSDTKSAVDLSKLPTSRYFKQVGVVIARDSWDFNNSTLFIFKSSPFYNAGHHNRDENAFTIDYKTQLALDSGYYDETDSEHYKNYSIRTIAHNAITVYNPQQIMEYVTDYDTGESAQERKLINDGGQIFRDPDSLGKADIVEGGKNRLDGIMQYHYDGNYTYALGDATKAYDPKTVTLAKREVMYLKDAGFGHPVVLVLDKVSATDGNFTKRYLLHTQPDVAPIITGKRMEVTVSDGEGRSAQLVNLTLYPQDANLTSIGGAGAAYQLMDGSNPEPVHSANVETVEENNNTKSGTYRLEVSPPLGKKYDVMLNALFVDDAGKTIDTAQVSLIDDNDSIGVELPNRVVVFSKAKRYTPSPISYHVRKASNVEHTVVTGYKVDDNVSVTIGNGMPTTYIVGKGGCVDFKLQVQAGDEIKVSK